MHICIYAYRCRYLCVCMYVCMYVCMHVCMYVCIYIYIYTLTSGTFSQFWQLWKLNFIISQCTSLDLWGMISGLKVWKGAIWWMSNEHMYMCWNYYAWNEHIFICRNWSVLCWSQELFCLYCVECMNSVANTMWELLSCDGLKHTKSTNWFQRPLYNCMKSSCLCKFQICSIRFFIDKAISLLILIRVLYKKSRNRSGSINLLSFSLVSLVFLMGLAHFIIMFVSDGVPMKDSYTKAKLSPLFRRHLTISRNVECRMCFSTKLFYNLKECRM